MKSYEVKFIFTIPYIEAENENDALEHAQDCLISLNWSDWDEVTIEEIGE